jgi:ubiquinone/menaquinone biosynthesis C-methylase UbiE
MQTSFDKIAHTYDETFTNSLIGRYQRNVIWQYLDNIFLQDKKLNVLDLNCGTGEDAIYLANKGHQVTATDLSDNMLQVTEEKIDRNQLNEKIITQKIDLNHLNDSTFKSKFDLILSNFGGINCIDKPSVKNLNDIIGRILSENGRVVLVVMGKFSLWESVYFLSKLKIKNVFRRLSSKPSGVNLNRNNVKTYYYSPTNLAKIFKKNFIVRKIMPVGLFVPPSYLNHFFLNKIRSLNFLSRLDKHINNLSLTAYASDHYLIDLELKR